MRGIKNLASRTSFVLWSCFFGLTGCGYHLVDWNVTGFKTLEIEAIQTNETTRSLRTRMRDALIERCLSGSALQPVDEGGDLRLRCELVRYRQSVIATAADGRTTRFQFELLGNFTLKKPTGETLWRLSNYRYSDQYSISTSQNEYRDEAVFEQDIALKTIADLMITNISLALIELGRENE